jgi:hypothetical protein
VARSRIPAALIYLVRFCRVIAYFVIPLAMMTLPNAGSALNMTLLLATLHGCLHAVLDQTSPLDPSIPSRQCVWLFDLSMFDVDSVLFRWFGAALFIQDSPYLRAWLAVFQHPDSVLGQGVFVNRLCSRPIGTALLPHMLFWRRKLCVSPLYLRIRCRRIFHWYVFQAFTIHTCLDSISGKCEVCGSLP